MLLLKASRTEVNRIAIKKTSPIAREAQFCAAIKPEADQKPRHTRWRLVKNRSLA
jgi:hypothetical protein